MRHPLADLPELPPLPGFVERDAKLSTLAKELLAVKSRLAVAEAKVAAMEVEARHTRELRAEDAKRMDVLALAVERLDRKVSR